MLIRVLREYLRPYYGPLALVLLLQLVANAAALYLPTLNARIIDDGIATGDTGTIVRLGAVMLGGSVLQMAGQIGAVWFGARSAMAFGRDLRGAIFARTLDFSAREVATFGAPSLITRTTNRGEITGGSEIGADWVGSWSNSQGQQNGITCEQGARDCCANCTWVGRATTKMKRGG